MASSAVQRTLLSVLALLVAAIAVVVVVNRPAQSGSLVAPRSQFDGPTLPPGLRAAQFTLADQTGGSVSLSRYRGHVVVLTFIHSLCHDACPFMVEQIKGAMNTLPGAGRDIPVIGITVDPGEDTVANRRRFVTRHRMRGRLAFLSGPVPVLRSVWHSYAIQPVQGPIDHSTFVLLIDRSGIERVGFAAAQLTPEGLAHDIRVLERERPGVTAPPPLAAS